MEGKTYILVIAGIYMLLMIAIGFIGKQRAKKATDYLLCGRNLGILMTLSLIHI